MSKIFKTLLFMVSIIVLISGCTLKPDNDFKETHVYNTPLRIEDIITPSPENEGTKTIETPTPEPYSHSTEVNQFEHIGYYLCEWISENNTETIEDNEEGILIEDTNDDKIGRIGITLNEQNEPEVYIWMKSRISRTFKGTFIVVFDERGTAIINDLDEAIINDLDGEVKSINIKLGYNRYSISVDFVYDDKTVYMGFIRLDEYSRIAKCMEIVRDKNGVQSNIIDDGKYIIRYEGMDDDGIRITVSRVEDTVVRARYIFDRTTLQYKVD